MLYVIAYDIPVDRRRTKVARALSDFGVRIQYSVFECRLERDQFDEMLARIEALIDDKEDRLRVYRLCASCEDRVMIHGEKDVPDWEEDGFLIL